ncbi:DNA replication/repair protein RecF [Alkalibacter mobilis]|uniref:DNA replication/repair protein RecF n=1 Tax=Alkalibacter mobilis TaxID=2787712 RepID=UPI00189F9C50|nr:DNA replication/repair protein RecF [Alkalibacter mobilis]MBF7096088.1 DNA replication/repair protein RecF [Alkalibacter mobilis]
MYLKKLKFSNFRNYTDLEIELDPDLNLILGENGQGKTNLLEGIYFLARGKSFRNQNRDLVNFESEKSFAEGFFFRERLNNSDTVRISIDKNSSSETTGISINRNKVKSKNDLAGKFFIVDFTPEDLSIIREGPEKRRRFIDNEMLNIKPVHGSLLKDYNKVLRQRNELLKNISRDQSLKKTAFIWDEKLVELGIRVIVNRIVFMQKLNRISKEIHTNLTDDKENLKLYYYSNLIRNNDDIENLEKIFREKLEENFKEDLKKGYTSIGPHLDDIKININDMDVKTYGSQGQKRTCALSLKLSQTRIIKEETHEDPIILLDDVMSELDPGRQQRIMEHFKDNQVVITSTEINFLDKLQNKSKKIYTVKGGKVI